MEITACIGRKYKENLMKKKCFLTIVLIMAVNAAVFSQTPVSVPNNFVGTWWYDATFYFKAMFGAPDGTQWLWSYEIRKDGTWMRKSHFKAYNQMGLEFLTKEGYTNGQVNIESYGYVTAATSVEIVLTKHGETSVYERLSFFREDISESGRRLYTKNEPQLPK
jgi:hypothetical protein